MTVSASCQDYDWPGRGKVRPKPSVTQLSMTASDGRTREEGDGEGVDGVSDFWCDFFHGSEDRKQPPLHR